MTEPMESERSSIFPVFGQLHADDSPAVVVPCEKPARKVHENTAKLFVVSADEPEPEDDEDAKQLTELIEEAKREQQSDLLKVTGEIERDTVTALYCLAFLSGYFSALETGDLCKIADLIRGRR